MKIEVKDLKGSKKEIQVVITVEEMEKYVESRIKEISKEITINGFRKGSAPKEVIENKVGKEKIFQEAAEDAIRLTYPKIIEDNNFFTIASPHIEITKCAPGNEVEYKATVYVLPEIILPDYKKIAKKTIEEETKETKIEESEIEKVLKMLQNMKAKKTATNREAKKGDLITIDFKGTFEEKKEKEIEEKNFQLILGEEEINVLDGFEENIYNMKPQEEKEFSLDIPNITDSQKKDKVNFQIKIINIMERELPKIDDNFAMLFNLKSLNDLKEQIKKDLIKEKETKNTEELKNKILQMILEESKLEVPEILIERELDNMIKTVENQLKEKNISIDDYLKEIKKTMEEIRESWRKQAEKNVSFALILHKIGVNEDVSVEDKEIEDEVKKHFHLMGKKIEEEEDESINRIKSYTYDVIKNQKIFNLLLTN